MRIFPNKGFFIIFLVVGVFLFILLGRRGNIEGDALGGKLDRLSDLIFSSKKQEEMLSLIENLEILKEENKWSIHRNRISFLKGILYSKMDSFEEAISSWADCYATRGYHLSPLALLYASVTLESLGRLEEAVESFTLHSKRYPDHFTKYEAILGISRCLFSLSKKEESKRVLSSYKFDRKNQYGSFFNKQYSFFSQDF